MFLLCSLWKVFIVETDLIELSEQQLDKCDASETQMFCHHASMEDQTEWRKEKWWTFLRCMSQLESNLNLYTKWREPCEERLELMRCSIESKADSTDKDPSWELKRMQTSGAHLWEVGLHAINSIRCRLQSEGWRLWTSILFCSGLPHCMQSHSFLSTPLCCHTRHCADVLGIFFPL